MSDITIADITRLVFRDYEVNGKRSLDSIRYHAKHLTRLFDDKSLPTTNDIEEYKASRIREGAASATIKNELSILKVGFKHAVNCNLIGFGDVPKIIMPLVDNVREVIPTPEQVLKVIEYMRVVDDNLADLIKWYVLTGWRKREATRLTWKNVMADRSGIYLSCRKSKNRKPRQLAFGAETKSLIDSRWEKRDGPFVFHRYGREIKSFTYTWRKNVKAVGIPDLEDHDLRRFFAQTGIDSGIPESILMKIGGWLTNATFKRDALVNSEMMAK